MMTLLYEAVAVWIDAAGRPQALVWGTEHYTVSDTPTRLEAVFADHVTHLPTGFRDGWRFQGTTADARSRVFDVRKDGLEGRWVLVGTYE